MDYAFASELKDGYLHVRVHGDNDPPTVRRYLKDILLACAREDCPNVLIEENLEGTRLGMGDIFDIVSEKSGSFRPAVRLVAYVGANIRGSMSNMKFAETVAVNRGIRVSAFATVADAEKWLRKSLSAAAKKPKRRKE